MEKHHAKCLRCPLLVRRNVLKTIQKKKKKTPVPLQFRNQRRYELESESSEVEVDEPQFRSPEIPPESESVLDLINSNPTDQKLTHSEITTYFDKMREAEMVNFIITSSFFLKCNIVAQLSFLNLQKNLWKLLGRAIYATATPFTIVENSHWINFFRGIRPSFSLPSRYQISTPLLEKEYLAVKTLVSERIEHSNAVSLQIDGWTNVK